MSSSNPDMSQYLGLFLDEAREQLGVLETHILQMERGDHSKEILQTLFRAAHTLKGSSRAMGYMEVGDLTHKMEDVLDELRGGNMPVTTAIVDVLLQCLDALGSLVDAIATAQPLSVGLESSLRDLTERLHTLKAGEPDLAQEPDEMAPVDLTPIATTQYEQTAIDEAVLAGLTVFHIIVNIHPDCLMKSVRVYMVLGALEPIGTVLVARPSEEELDAEEFGLTFQLLFASDMSSSIIEAALNGISEIAGVTTSEWGRSAESVQPAAPPPAVTDSDPVKDTAAGVAKPEPAAANSVGPSVPQASQGATSDAKLSPAHGQTIRVDVARLDNLLNLIGEMVIDRTQIARVGSDLQERYPHDEIVGQLVDATNRLARIASELQEEIMKARMLPVDGVFQRMPRMVRDLAQRTGKEVEFVMSGGETELDRSVLETLGDPLIHMLRNAVDHGIEPTAERIQAGKSASGRICLSARHEENHILIEITDDGRGMDAERLKSIALNKGIITPSAADAMTERDALMLIFASGFSTAEALTDISGRGVGMDIVRSNLERLGGRVQVETKLGAGSRFIIRLPLTLAIVRALTVTAGGGTYVLPLSSVEEMLRLSPRSKRTESEDNHAASGRSTSADGTVCHTVGGGQAAIVLRNATVPLVNLADLLAGDKQATCIDHIADDAYVIVIGHGAKRVGLCVEGLGGEQEVVIKSLGTLLGDIPGLAGATILGDGRVALIIDIGKAIESIAGLDNWVEPPTMMTMKRAPTKAKNDVAWSQSAGTRQPAVYGGTE